MVVAKTQAEHSAINAKEFPGTRQMCVACRQPTGRYEEDAIYDSLGNGPMCPECWHLHPEYGQDADTGRLGYWRKSADENAWRERSERPR